MGEEKGGKTQIKKKRRTKALRLKAGATISRAGGKDQATKRRERG